MQAAQARAVGHVRRAASNRGRQSTVSASCGFGLNAEDMRIVVNRWKEKVYSVGDSVEQ